jgi:hypothetical protein
MGPRGQEPATVRTRRLAVWTRYGGSQQLVRDDPRKPKTLAEQGFSIVAGAGFEPATFGL